MLVCSVFDDPFLIQRALDLGACGYVAKNKGKNDLLAALNAAAQGDVYVSGGHDSKWGGLSGTYTRLTKREIDVLQLIK